MAQHERVRSISTATRQRTLTREEAELEAAFAQRYQTACGDGMYPLDAPGMPLPGLDFLRYAQAQGDDSELYKETVKDEAKKSGKRTEERCRIGETLKNLYYRALRTPGFTLPIMVRGGVTTPVTFIPGHIWSQGLSPQDLAGDAYVPVDGPHPADVFVLGKMPWDHELAQLRNFVGPTGEILTDILHQFHVRGTPFWYVTNLLKFKPPDGSTTIKAAWLKDCLPLLHQELRIVQPKYILCLGADASKALLGSKHGVSSMDGRVVEYRYPTGDSLAYPRHQTALVMTVVHPAQVAREESSRRQLERGIARFNLLQTGIRFDKEEKDIHHHYLSNLEDLEALLYEVEHDPEKQDDFIGVDAEWEGEHPVNKGAYLRTVQLAWRPKHAVAIRLRAPGGKVAIFDAEGKPAFKRTMQLLTVFFKGGTYNGKQFRRKRAGGHFFVADLEWLVYNGLDLRDEFAVPLYDLDLSRRDIPKRLRQQYESLGFTDKVPAWVRTKFEGGADTGMMAHAIEETAQLKLETLATRYTTVPRYDLPLQEWKERYCREQNIEAKDLEGYGNCPDDVLMPYGAYDADACLRLFYEFSPMLDLDYEGNCCREPFWESMIALPAILEIHRNGISVDRERIETLTKNFLQARGKQEELLKGWSKWPDFNIRSVQHVKEFLFGAALNGKVTKDGKPIRIRPSDAMSLHVTPLTDTSKPPKLWLDLVAKHEEKQHSPSTNKQVLAILGQENEKVSTQINWIRDYRFLDQVLKNTLRPPRTDEKTGEWLSDSDTGELIYDAGLASVICSDGRVRTHIYPTAETGRWKSARPNLQNISSQRDADYVRLLGEEGYRHKLRSIFTADDGYLLVECDYTGAELFGMAVMSGDPTMIEHAQRNQLPEEHPNFYDIHSNTACLAFQLRCEPTKSGLKSINKSHLRIIAKAVLFGICYGRGAKAIAFAAKEQGVHVSVQEAQQVIDTIFQLYPGLLTLFEACRERAVGARWLCHCFGRLRRFPLTQDQSLQSEFERQAMNFPIQGMIASAVDRAIAYLYDFRNRYGDPDLFKILLQIHDSLLLAVPYRHVEFVTQKALPWAMREMVPIYPTTLDGVPTGAGPYYLGAEGKVMRRWGELLPFDEVKKLGITQKTWAGNGFVIKYAA